MKLKIQFGKTTRFDEPIRRIIRKKVRENESVRLRRLDNLQILQQAHRLYRQQMVWGAFGRSGGSLERTIQLNDTRGKIERRFRKHGHELS